MENSSSVKRWSSRITNPIIRKNYLYRFSQWMKWLSESDFTFAKLTSDELLDYQKSNPMGYDILDEAQNYINLPRELEWRFATKQSTYSIFKSFFAHNHAPLPNDPSFRITTEVKPARALLYM